MILNKGQNHMVSKHARFKGAPIFTSISVLSGKLSTLKDDLESLGYIIVYLMTGSLPWLTSAKRKFKNSTGISVRKQMGEDEFDVQRLILLRDPSTLCAQCDGKLTFLNQTKVEIQQYLTYCQTLMKGKRPDYKYLKSLLFDIRKREDSNENMEWYEMYVAEQTDQAQINMRLNQKITQE